MFELAAAPTMSLAYNVQVFLLFFQEDAGCKQLCRLIIKISQRQPSRGVNEQSMKGYTGLYVLVLKGQGHQEGIFPLVKGTL